MAEKIDLDAMERANLGGRVVRPEDWMAVLAYARELEGSVESLAATISNVDKAVRETLGIDPNADDALPELVADWLESASQAGGGEADTARLSRRHGGWPALSPRVAASVRGTARVLRRPACSN